MYEGDVGQGEDSLMSSHSRDWGSRTWVGGEWISDIGRHPNPPNLARKKKIPKWLEDEFPGYQLWVTLRQVR